MEDFNLVNHKDIQIFTGKVGFVGGNALYCSSLDGNRAIGDVFDILDYAVTVGPSNAFVLRGIDDQGNFLSTICQRSDLGTFSPGRYLIVPQDNGVEVLRKEQETFGDRSREVPLSRRARVTDTSTEGSAASTRDDGPRGFKMRLVYRDKGCVVCHAEGTTSVYQYRDDSRFFEGSHIFPFALQYAWTLRGFQELMVDPYTATSTDNATRNKRDPLRINSLENGILLCLFHHKAFDTFRFSIHPTTRKIFAFHPAVTHLHGLEVTSPWKEPNSLYPGPHRELLKSHFRTSIFASLSAAAEPLELDDDEDDEDNEELPEIPSDHNEAVRIWASDSTDRYPPVEWRPDVEERNNSRPLAPKCKHVEIPQSAPNCAVV